MPKLSKDELSVVRAQVQTLSDAYSGGKLSKWEEGFLFSVSDQLDRTGSLSEKQCETLEKIYQEKC